MTSLISSGPTREETCPRRYVTFILWEDNSSYLEENSSYLEDNSSYLEDKLSYLEDNSSYLEDTLSYLAGTTQLYRICM
jgi:hypothetical protein